MLKIPPEVEHNLARARALSLQLDDALFYIGKRPKFRDQLEDRLDNLRQMFCTYDREDTDETRSETTLFGDGTNPLYYDFLCEQVETGFQMNGGLLCSLPVELRDKDPRVAAALVGTEEVEILPHHGWSIHT